MPFAAPSTSSPRFSSSKGRARFASGLCSTPPDRSSLPRAARAHSTSCASRSRRALRRCSAFPAWAPPRCARSTTRSRSRRWPISRPRRAMAVWRRCRASAPRPRRMSAVASLPCAGPAACGCFTTRGTRAKRCGARSPASRTGAHCGSRWPGPCGAAASSSGHWNSSSCTRSLPRVRRWSDGWARHPASPRSRGAKGESRCASRPAPS